MPYRIEVEQVNEFGVQTRYTWVLRQWKEHPIPFSLVPNDHWWYLDSGDSKYKWNAKRSAIRAMKRHKKHGEVEEKVVFEKEFE